jgi:hypothetical protein
MIEKTIHRPFDENAPPPTGLLSISDKTMKTCGAFFFWVEKGMDIPKKSEALA